MSVFVTAHYKKAPWASFCILTTTSSVGCFSFPYFEEILGNIILTCVKDAVQVGCF